MARQTSAKQGSLFGQERSGDPPTSARPFVPARGDLDELRAAARGCRGCPLWEHATQTVFGLGPSRARVMFVGEQPGHEEDLAGEPFVGPAGRVLAGALESAGIDRQSAYVTNAVKHFKWAPKGKRRLHMRPHELEILACQPWLEAEIAEVKPSVVVCLGATAARSILGPKARVNAMRGQLLRAPLAARVVVTIHPSAILRVPDADARRAELARLVDDLRFVASLLEGEAASPR